MYGQQCSAEAGATQPIFDNDPQRVSKIYHVLLPVFLVPRYFSDIILVHV